MLEGGGIVAVKGLGGFHLVCDALNPQAVRKLRARKQRPTRPLAVMIPHANDLPKAIQTLLRSPAAPIMLTPKACLPAFPEEIAPGLNTVGVMLPANPLQHLLMLDCQRPLVMTSGNLSGHPPVINNQQALEELSDIADGFLLHNRDILQRMDDSVMDQEGTMLRRARGFVPDAITLPAGFRDIPPMLCTGAEMKNTFCLVRGNQAVLSQHFGDLSDEGVEAQWRSALSTMQEIYAFQPERVVCDAHPGYHARQWARTQALPVETVLHHHAHAAACLAENGWPLDGGDVIALTLDGIGMGENGALWGAECLRVKLSRLRTAGRSASRCAAGGRSGGKTAVAQFARPLSGVRT